MIKTMTTPDWEKIYETYSGKVMGYIAARVQRRADAEDLCADVFEKAYKKIDAYDEKKASMSTWIFTITRNTVIDYFRKNRPTAELDENMPSDSEVDESLLRNFYWFDGALWALNRIIDYSLTTSGPTKCEFVKVQDKTNYTSL